MTFPRERPGSYADALVVLAETLLAAGGRHLAGGDRYQVVVHVDLATLTSASRCAGGRAETEHGMPLLSETLRRLCCDGGLLPAVTDPAGRPLDVGRKTRSIPAAIRRALRIRDRGCRYPGCEQARRVDGHHIRHWARGGPTSLSNLVLLCEFHRRAVHERGFTSTPAGSGRFRVARSDGTPHPEAAPSGPHPGRLQDRQPQLRILADTIGSAWAGERFALQSAVAALPPRELPVPTPG